MHGDVEEDNNSKDLCVSGRVPMQCAADILLIGKEVIDIAEFEVAIGLVDHVTRLHSGRFASTCIESMHDLIFDIWD